MTITALNSANFTHWIGAKTAPQAPATSFAASLAQATSLSSTRSVATSVATGATPMTDSTGKLDFSNMPLGQFTDWLNKQVKENTLTLDQRVAFQLLAGVRNLDGSRADPNLRMDFIARAQSGAEGAKLIGDKVNTRFWQDAADFLLNQQGKGAKLNTLA